MDAFDANGFAQNSAIILQGGETQYRHDTDHELLFRQESFFHYLFGVKEPDFYGAVCLDTKKSILFIPRLPQSYAVWMGEIYPPEYFVRLYGVDEVFYVDEMAHTLRNILGTENLYVLDGKNTDSGSNYKHPEFAEMDTFHIETKPLMHLLSECRLIKTEHEIELMRYACRISSEAHTEVMKKSRPGMSEFQCEAIFKYYVYDKGGCRNCSYTCICASGSAGAILHYGHAGAPNDRVIQDGDMMMFDMGAEYHCYGADISRSYPINGVFTDDQRLIYETVLAAQQAVLDIMKPGINWRDMHRLAERIMMEKLLEHGFLNGTVDELMEAYIPNLFMPHGLGHLLGIDTHDVGGYPGDMLRTQEPGLKSLRCGRELLEGMILTVEPGLYFNRFNLEPAFTDEKYSKYLNADKIRQFFSFGGVRIEDDVVVTADGIEILSNAPKTVEEIEAVMRSK
jgi:Xaa-Pro dipeptidase